MKGSDRFTEIFQRLLPSPLAIALILTVLTFILAGALTHSPGEGSELYIFTLTEFWYLGFWAPSLMVFAMQMMLILVLGHILALSGPINNLLNILVKGCSKTANAAAIVCLFTLLVSFFNWGLGLVFGAIFARKVAENAIIHGYKISYPLIGAAAYSGLMVWHGGLSGSAPLKVAEQGHFLEDQLGVISLSETVFSTMNIVVALVLLFTLPLILYFLGKRVKDSLPQVKIHTPPETKEQKYIGAEKIDNSPVIARLTGSFLLLWAVYLFFTAEKTSLSVITPNFINLTLFGLAVFFHRDLKHFLIAANSAISGASGILIQFPFYFGIMGMMKYSGLTVLFSDFFISISTPETFSVLTMISAGVVNIFVPSGGGQWAIQGPVIAEAVIKLNIPPAKAVMALAYGDQLTNMLQPFWALPLLGITGLKAKEILPFTFILMLAGGLIYTAALLLF